MICLLGKYTDYFDMYLYIKAIRLYKMLHMYTMWNKKGVEQQK